MKPWVMRASLALALSGLAVAAASAQVPVELNADGDGDVFLYDPAQGDWSIQTRTAGGFAGAPGLWSPGWSVAPGDFDGDHVTDLFLFDSASGQWFRMRNADGASFAVDDSAFWWPGWQRHVVDLDGDGRSDVFLWDPASGAWFKCLTRAGGFTYLPGFWTPGWDVYPVRLDDDDRQDFFLVDPGSGQWFQVRGADGAGFTYPATGHWSNDWELVPGDFTGDGITDVLLSRAATGQWFVARTVSTGFTYSSGFFSTGWDFHAMDLDADGDDDLLLHNPSNGQWFELLSDGASGFTTSASGFWSVGWDLHPTDFDRDGRADLLLYDPASGHWFQAINTGPGTFAYHSGIWNPGLTIVTGPSGPPPEMPDMTRANSWDDRWETAWVTHGRTLLATPGRTGGFVLQVGDSITHSRAYSAWALGGAGRTSEDSGVMTWAHGGSWGANVTDAANKNGLYLAGADTTGQRGMTASGGITLAEFVTGCCNGGPTMPAETDTATARTTVADGTYTGNLRIDTVTAAFDDAAFAVVMLGTNDPGSASALTDLTTVVDTLESAGILPILSTIPPRSDGLSNQLTLDLNAGVRTLAESRSLPLIDFYREILRRRPGWTWMGTLISGDGVHPTGDRDGYTVTSDPYAGGDAETHTTGAAAANVGYLLRSWLTVQKLKEVKRYVVDEVDP